MEHDAYRCLGCWKAHDGGFTYRFCSNSCRLIHRLRITLGLRVLKG